MALGNALGLPFRRGSASAFDPDSLFGASDEGVVLDNSNPANLFQLSGGTTAITVAGQPIGYSTDLSGKGHHATQATAANRPFWTGVPRSLGAELVTNGRFVADTDWTKGAGWSIAGGVATAVAGSASTLSEPITLAAGKTYVIVWNVLRTAGTITAQFTGGTTVNGQVRSAIGSYIEIVTANTNTTLTFSKDATFAGGVYNVTVKEVTSFVNRGAFFYGNPFQLTTAAINCSASGKATIVAAFKQDASTGSQNVLIHGAYGSVSGSILCDLAAQPHGRIYGTAGAVAAVPTDERGSGVAMREYCNVYSFDMTGATIADQTKVRTRGILPTQTTSGSLNGATALANAAFRIGANSHRGLIQRLIFINRELTESERIDAQAWAMEGRLFACIMGDSTVAVTVPTVPNTQRISDLVGGLICGAADLAESGRRIADMLSFWNALADKSALQVVIVQIGLNDVKGRVGANTATSAQVIADYQALIDDINADKPAGCKVYVSAMTPCKVWLDAATNPSAAYAAWQNLNEAIAGNGATPITGVDGRITSHVAALSDGADNLLPIYDHEVQAGFAGGVHPSNEARIIIAQAWRTALEADGLLEAP